MRRRHGQGRFGSPWFERVRVGPIRFRLEKPYLTAELPSGRKLWYLHPRVRKAIIKYRDAETNEEKSFEKDSVSYMGKQQNGKKWIRIQSHGGKFIENFVQAIARDILREGLIAAADDAFLAKEGLDKGSMRLIDAAEATRLYGRMGPGREISGGSAGNTAAGVAMLGGRAGFIGQVADDQLGDVYRHDVSSIGVEFTTPARPQAEAPTARSLVLVTPDAQRTMNTFLGAAQNLSSKALDEAQLRRTKILYLEGYLWDPEVPRAAMERAIEITRDAGGQVARLGLDPVQGYQSMAAYIAAQSRGDIPTGSVEYGTIFAVGLTLFAMTLLLNAVSIRLVRRYRQVYE